MVSLGNRLYVVCPIRLRNSNGFIASTIGDFDQEALWRLASEIFGRPTSLLLGVNELVAISGASLESCRKLASRWLQKGWIQEYVEVPMFDRPTFIIAAPRSGSTLLFESLRKIPGMWSIGRESHEIFDGVLEHHVGNPQFESIRATARDVEFEKTQSIIRYFTRHLIDSGLERRYVDLTPDHRPKSIRFLDKLPKNSFRVPFLADSFPDAKFIFLTRNPRENISSLIDGWNEGRRSGRFVTYRQLPGTAFESWCFVLPPGWRGMLNESVADIAAFQWAKSNETALDDLLLLAPDRWCAVSFTSLISQPIAELRRLGKFIGLEFDAAALGMQNGVLAVSSSALSLPSPDKWRKNAIEIERLLPQVEATAARIENAIALKTRNPFE